MISLKDYQKDTLSAIEKFLNIVLKDVDVKKAYQSFALEEYNIDGKYNDNVFNLDEYKNIPYVCLRLPTGGGKTFLAACTIPLVNKEYLGRVNSLVVWLVPTTAILEQTYNCLNYKMHPYRRILDDAFEGNVRILKIDDALSISKSDVSSNVNIIISTVQSFKDKTTEGRRVYRPNGSLSEHFERISISNGKNLLCYEDTNKVIPSLVNLININNPLVIVDEAHNARTDLTFDTLELFNPSCIIEYTATPKTIGNDRSNILYRVSAATLKAEKMIKMPIVLLTNEDWQIVINGAVDKQKELENLANEEEENTGEYIRPIVLFQAENDSVSESTINVKVVKDFLINDCGIPQEQVAVATGDERGIEGKNLNDKSEPIRFIITKQALKEGWDCPFAYVFCSVANISSSKDVEQLLGRVLRLPNVKDKHNDALNKAYAFVSSKNFYLTAMNLKDSLTQGGFDSKEANQLIEINESQQNLGEFFGNPIRTFTKLPENRLIPQNIKDKIEIDKKNNTITFNKPITEDECSSLKEIFENENDKEIIDQVYKYTNRIKSDYICPQKKGEIFSIPQLCIDLEGENRVFDDESLLPSNWNLANCNPSLSLKEFPVKVDAGNKGILDLDERGNVTIKHSNENVQLELSSLVFSYKMDKNGLIRWLVKECQNPIIPQSQAVVFIGKLVDDLLTSRNLTVDQIAYKRMFLRKVIVDKISNLINEAKKSGFQSFFSYPVIEKDGSRIFSLGSDLYFSSIYPANDYYSGSLIFQKHYYELIGKMNEEEAECAFNIDSNPNVKFWVRNLERKTDSSFWLQTSTDKFYPDFIATLNNGKIVIIEYKGSDRYSDDDSREKRMIGDYYETISLKKCRFIMLKGKDWVSLKEKLEN